MSENTLVNEDTDTSTQNDQAASSKTYTQKEVDDMAARLKSSVAKKYEKQYGDIDVEEYRTLKAQAEEAKTKEAMKRGEFEKVLQEMAAKKDAEIAKRDSIIRDYKLNTPLLSAAAKFNAVAPEQVKALLVNSVQLSEDGEPVVVDNKGNIRYSDSGTPVTIDDYVQEFLKTNPHFVRATPATTNTKSNVNSDNSSKIDVTRLNMSDPKDRELYKKYRKENGIA